MKTPRLALSAVVAALLAGRLPAQNDLPPDAIPKPDPAEQMATFVLDEGLEINLFAADPLIAKPVGMNWDEQGRLWVVSSRLYPHIKPGERSDDQVVVLEDTDGDGAADKSTVFAEDLLIPTGVMPGDGGAYVANSTEMLFLKDTDGDLEADERRVVLSGFGTEDTHHIIHAFRGGPDGMLYFNQSIYIHSHVETPHGLRRLLAGGIWHFRPETAELEVFARGFVNSWGHAFDRYGQSFATDGAFGEGINYVFPGAVFFTAHNAKKILRGLNPGQPKQCGLEVVYSSHFPEEWQGNLITNDFRGHRVNRFVVSESGSGYVSRQAPDLIRTTHGAFRPVDVKVGPDGALYIADWYNPIIQHGEVDFRDPRRDHEHGRIWRVTYKGRPLAKRPEVVGAGLPAVVAQLRSPEGAVRHAAKRELRNRERGAVLAELAKLKAEPGLRGEDKLEILWANQGVGSLDEALLRELLGGDDHRLRAAAVRVLYHWHGRLDDSAGLLAEAAMDPHPQVRLEAVGALRQVGGLTSFRAILPVFGSAIDTNLDFALWLAARELEADWLPALESGELDFAGRGDALNFCLKAIEKPGALRFLRGQLAGAEGEPFRELAALFGDVAGGADLDALYAAALGDGRDAAERQFALGQLLRAARERNARPADLRGEVLLEQIDAGDAAAARLAGTWKLEEARGALAGWLAESDRFAVGAEALAAYGDGSARDALAGLAGDRGRGIAARAAGAAGVAASDRGRGAKLAAAVLADAEDGDAVDALFGAFLAHKDGPAALAKALSGTELAPAVATAGVKLAGQSGGETAGLVSALTEAGGLQPIARGLSAEEMAAFVADVARAGDPARGEEIYRRGALLCQTCHAIGGGGGLIGPDLVSIGSSAPVDYIVDSLLEPAKKIKEGYHTTVVTQKNGGVVTGTLVRETDRELVLRAVDGSESTVPVANIAKKEIAPVSLMPAGLTAGLRRDELVDLVRFLSELGKEGAYKVPAGRTVRRWRVLPYNDEVSHQIRRVGTQAMLGADRGWPWNAAYSTVAGELPLAAMGVNKGFSNDLSFAKFEIEVSAAGEIGFRIDNPQGLQVLLGGAMVAAKSDTRATLEVGRHEVVVLVDRASRSQGGLKIELVDVPGSPGRATVVGGL